MIRSLSKKKINRELRPEIRGFAEKMQCEQGMKKNGHNLWIYKLLLLS